MNADQLSIRISQESECWEDMVEKTISYLAKYRQGKLEQKDRDMQEARKQDESRANENPMHKAKTGKGGKKEEDDKAASSKKKANEKIDSVLIRA